ALLELVIQLGPAFFRQLSHFVCDFAFECDPCRQLRHDLLTTVCRHNPEVILYGPELPHQLAVGGVYVADPGRHDHADHGKHVHGSLEQITHDSSSSSLPSL